MRDLPPGVAARLHAVAWDDRIAAYRAAPSDWPRLREHLAREGLATSDDSLVPFERALAMSAQPALALRAYQRAALAAWTACGRRGVIVLPTGAGKTRVALAAIAATGLPALVLVPTRALMAQWVEALGSLGAGPVGQVGDGRASVQALTVATFESAWRHAPGLGDRFGLLVVDEAHHVGGALRTEPLEMSLAPFRLGLTALPPRARRFATPDAPVAGRPAGRPVDEILGPVVFQLRVRDLAGTSLAPLRLVGIGLDMTPEERARWTADMSRYRAERARRALDLLGLPWSGIAATLGQTLTGRRALAARGRAIALASLTACKALVLAAILERHRDDRALVFTRDNASAYAIAREHLIPAVTCDIGSRERRETLAAFARGDVRALVSARVLDEGLDIPAASVAIIVGASGSERQHVQRVGRILRPAPGKRAVVYDLFDMESGDAARASRRRAIVAS